MGRSHEARIRIQCGSWCFSVDHFTWPQRSGSADLDLVPVWSAKLSLVSEKSSHSLKLKPSLYSHRYYYFEFINIKNKKWLFAFCCMSTEAFASIRHLTVSVGPFWDASISAVNSSCKSNKYHLNEKHSIKVKNCNIRKCCVSITSIFISSEILTQI